MGRDGKSEAEGQGVGDGHQGPVDGREGMGQVRLWVTDTRARLMMGGRWGRMGTSEGEWEGVGGGHQGSADDGRVMGRNGNK